MSEPRIRRIVIACDAACDIRVAVEDAAILAERWNAALHGIFLEDENLRRLAGLPFGQVTLSSAISEAFEPADFEKLSSARGTAMRRALAEEAAQRGLEWSFGILRDLPKPGAPAEIEADMLVVETARRPFAGSWRPRSPWDKLSEEYTGTMLIRRQRRTGPGTVAVLLDRLADRDKVLRAGFAMAAPGDEILALWRGGAPADQEAAKAHADTLAAASRRKLRFEPAPAEIHALLRRIERLKPALIVTGAGEAEGQAVRDLLAGTSCDVLLVR
jgi:hypothetical protein